MTEKLVQRLENAAMLATPERARENLCMEASVTIKGLIAALNCLLEQTVDMDLALGVVLTAGEREARDMALAAIVKATREDK